MSADRCFACGRRLGNTPALVDTRDDQLVFVGVECARQVDAAGEAGYQPPKGGPRLYPLPAVASCYVETLVGTIEARNAEKDLPAPVDAAPALDTPTRCDG